MHNKFIKGVASVLGAALVLGSVLVSAVPAEAKTVNGNEVTYTASELQLSETMFGECTVEDAGSGAVKITFPSQYNQVFFVIPEEVKAAGWQTAIVKTGDSDTGYTFKMTDENGTDGSMRGVVADYPSANEIHKDASYIDPWGGDPAATEADLDKVVYVDIMNGSEGSLTVTLKSVTFTTDKAVAGGSEESKTDDTAKEDAPAATTTTSSKTGESATMVWVVCVLGGLLLMAGAGMFVTEKKRR